MPFILAASALAITAYSTERSIDAARDAKRFREQQANEERKRANIQNIRGMREQIRAQRAAAAEIANASAISGTSQSSGAAGGIAGSQADLAGNIAFVGQMSEIDKRVGQAGMGVVNAQTQGQIAGAYGALSGTIFTGAGGFKPLIQ